jgi:hypothetical protein
MFNITVALPLGLKVPVPTIRDPSHTWVDAGSGEGIGLGVGEIRVWGVGGNDRSGDGKMLAQVCRTCGPRGFGGL